MDAPYVKKLLGYLDEVLKSGFGEVRIIIQGHKVLDIIPAPRIRMDEKKDEKGENKD